MPRRHLHSLGSQCQEASRPVCVMICNEENVHGVRPDAVNLIQVVLGIGSKPVHISALRRIRNQALRLAG